MSTPSSTAYKESMKGENVGILMLVYTVIQQADEIQDCTFLSRNEQVEYIYF